MTATSTNRTREALGMEVATRAPANEPAIYALTRGMEDQFADAVASGLSARTLVRDGITALRNTRDLDKVGATPMGQRSFFGALMTAAQLGLRPNVASLGHGWVLPFYDGKDRCFKAQWILGYQGMVELAYRSGMVDKLVARTIFAGEPHRVAWGTEDLLVHEPAPTGEADGDREPLWHYAVAWRGGTALWNALTEAQVREVMEKHAPRNRDQKIVGPWVQHYLPQARKTAMRGLWRWLPKSPAMALALDTDSVVRTDLSKAPVLDADEVVDTTAEDAPDEPAREQATGGGTPAAERGSSEAHSEPERPAAPEPGEDTGNGSGEHSGAYSEPEPGELQPWPTADGGHRDPQPVTKTRQAYMTRILEVHGEGFRGAVEQLVGEWVPPHYLTTPELRGLASGPAQAQP